ncbi:MAG: type II toxin-antitoxin system RelE/ParE family toxin [Lacipirellulaceae bacterium]
MLPVIWSSEFGRDLAEIWDFLSERSSEAADRVVFRIDEVVTDLGRHPGLGEAVPQFAPRRRRIVVGSYVVYYDVLPDAVHVLRVYHGSRNVHGG